MQALMERKVEKAHLARQRELEALASPAAARPNPPRHIPPGACLACSGVGFVRDDVPLGHPNFGKAIPCPDCSGGQLAEKLRSRSQLRGWLCEVTLDSYQVQGGGANAEALSAARAFAVSPVGWLTLWGPYGPGKTHLLAAIVNECIARRVGAVYFTLPDLLDELRNCREPYNDFTLSGLFERVRAVPVLALDELDKARLTDWALERIYCLLDARYREMDGKGTALALNVKPDPTCEGPLGYLFSRMSDRRCRVVEIGGGDARGVEFT